MRLRRIEAVRFGSLADSCAGELGDALTVVLGPNESGKSSYTALVRHVLYGFPDRRGKERTYLPHSGGRHGRLVFEDADGRWLVERTEGPHRGPLSVRALSGTDRPELVEEVTRGVSEATFRIVFGFGLDELAEIEQRSGDDVIGRLYAAGAGLGVSPLDIRKQLDARAAQLYLSGGQKPLVNTLAREIRDTKLRIRELEDAASSFTNDQARLHKLDEERAPLGTQLEALSRRSRQLALDLDHLKSYHDEAVALEPVLAEHRRKLTGLEQRLATVVPGERVLAHAVDLDVALAEVSAFRQRLSTLRDHEAGLAELASRIAEESRGLPDTVSPKPDLPAAIETWRDKLSRLEAAAELSARGADKASSTARRAEEEAAAAPAAGPRLTTQVAPIVMVLLGLVGIVTGVVTAYPLMTAFGALIAAAGVALLFWRPSGAGGESPRAAAGRDAEIARLRRAAAELADDASTDARALAAAREEWRSWLDARGFPETVDDPSGARLLADRLLERDRTFGERAQREAEVSGERQAAEAWAHDLAALCDGLVDVPEPLRLDDVAVLSARMSAALADARAAEAERVATQRDADALRETLDSDTARLEWLREHVQEIALRQEVANEDPVAALEARAEQVGREERELRAYDDDLARERHELAGKLGNEGRESAMADARQHLESLKVQAASAADRYVVVALASGLLARAQERYEHDRQPAVMRRAGELLATMTAGRYNRVQVPLGSGEVVVGSQDEARSTRELSRGTAEQLYLALRIGLVEQLDAVGESLPVLMDDVIVNFDAERREGAARAVAELATQRQIVFFTCHEETAELLDSVSDDCTRIALDRCAP